MDERSDYELIAGYLAGGDADFEELYERHRRRLYGYLNALLPGEGAEVDDLFQQTWLRAVEQFGKYRDQGCFSAWLFRIGRNLLIDRLRRTRNERMSVALDREDVPEPPAQPGMEPWRQLDEGELGVAIAGALAALPPEQREVFLLRRENVPFKEIAELQQCSINTALARMQYALKNLRQTLNSVDRGGLL